MSDFGDIKIKALPPSLRQMLNGNVDFLELANIYARLGAMVKQCVISDTALNNTPNKIILHEADIYHQLGELAAKMHALKQNQDITVAERIIAAEALAQQEIEAFEQLLNLKKEAAGLLSKIASRYKK